MRYKKLNLISKRRLVAICHHQLYQQIMAKTHDKKLRPKVFHEGDLVLRKILPLSSEDQS
jgi:hypothetical protein